MKDDAIAPARGLAFWRRLLEARRPHSAWSLSPESVAGRLFARFLGFLGEVPCRVLIPPKPDVERNTAILLIVNHRSLLDLLVGLRITSSWGLPVRPLVSAKYWKKPGCSLALRCCGAIPVRQSASGLGALRAAEDRLSSGGAIALAPEGTRVGRDNRVGGLGQLSDGAWLLARKTSARLLLLTLVGTDDVWPCLRRRPWRLTRRPVLASAVTLVIDPKFERSQWMTALRAEMIGEIARLEPDVSGAESDSGLP